MVSVLPRLCVLDVSCNHQLAQEVDAGGFMELGAALCHAAALTTLRLQSCGLTAACLCALGRRLTVTVSMAFHSSAASLNICYWFLNCRRFALLPALNAGVGPVL